MTAVAELIDQGRRELDALMVWDAQAKVRLQETLDAIEAVVTPARGKVSEAVTILRDPRLAPMSAAALGAVQLLDKALALLDGTQEPESGS